MKEQHSRSASTLFDLMDATDPASGFSSVTDERQARPSVTSPDAHLRHLQKQFDHLHEEIYKKGGVKPTNAAIDEVGKLIFLKLHLERAPEYRLQSGIGQGKRFADIFKSTYLQQRGKRAARELQDAFREISTLEQYATRDASGEIQTLFPYQEALRLDQPDVLAMAIELLSRISVSVFADQNVDAGAPAESSLAHQDLLGYAYDVFLRGRYDNAGGLGTYLTPNPVVEAMTAMAFAQITEQQLWAKRGDAPERNRWVPTPGEENLPAFLMGDICCGTGRFLVKALEETRRRIFDSAVQEDSVKIDWFAQLKRHSFLGADQSASSILKARINFLMFGESHARLLTVEDSILDERIDRLVGKFDLILTNPPFGDGKYETRAGLAKMRRPDLGLHLGWSWKNGEENRKPLPRADPALLFIDRNLQLLKPNGLLYIVVPDGILESAYTYAHRYLLGNAALRAVVSLPKDTFAIAGTTAKTSFVCFQKLATDNVKPYSVYMAVANHVGFIKKGKVEVPDPQGDDLPAIVTAWRDASRPEMTDEIFELNHQPPIMRVPHNLLSDVITAHTYHPDRLKAEKAINGMNGNSRDLSAIVSLVKPQVAGRDQQTQFFISVLHVDEKSNVDWNAATSHNPSSKGLRCYPNDIIFSCLNPSKVRVAVIPGDVTGQILCSTEFAILRCKPNEDPYFIALALKAETSQRQIIPMARGTSSSRRRVREQDLLGIRVPYPDSATRQRIAAQFRTALENARDAFRLNYESQQNLDEYIRSISAEKATTEKAR